MIVGWITRLDVGGSKVPEVSWIDFDQEALFFTGGEARVLGAAYHPADPRISFMA